MVVEEDKDKEIRPRYISFKLNLCYNKSDVYEDPALLKMREGQYMKRKSTLISASVLVIVVLGILLWRSESHTRTAIISDYENRMKEYELTMQATNTQLEELQEENKSIRDDLESRTGEVEELKAELAVLQAAEQKQSGSASQHEYSRHENGMFDFSVSYPIIWVCESQAYWYCSADTEAAPDNGVKIYLDSEKENYIEVYGQNGNMSTHGTWLMQYGYTKFAIDDKRVLYTKETDGFLEAQLFFKDNNHVSAMIRMESEVYKENEEEIWIVLDSINYKD